MKSRELRAFRKKRILGYVNHHAEIAPETPAAVDKFFVFVGKSPPDKAFAEASI